VSILDPDPPGDVDSEECRDVYAYFGVAYFRTEVLHRGLGNIFAFFPNDPSTMTQPWIEERLAVVQSMTLGQLVAATKPYLLPHLHDPLDEVLARRNDLAHSFWWDRAHEMMSPLGRAALIAWLLETIERTRAVDAEVDALLHDRWRAIDPSGELLEKCMIEVRAGPPPPLPTRAPLRVDDRVEVMEALLTGAAPSVKLLLVGRDGALWQLGESGLGWSYADRASGDWRPFKSLQRHLPATMVARPKGAKSWDYKLHLSTGHLLQVKRDADGVIRFGVRATGRPPRGV
jgi:hypothetical protein